MSRQKFNRNDRVQVKIGKKWLNIKPGQKGKITRIISNHGWWSTRCLYTVDFGNNKRGDFFSYELNKDKPIEIKDKEYENLFL